MLVRIAYSDEDQRVRRVGIRVEAVRQLGWDEDRVSTRYRVVIFANFDQAPPADDVNDVVAGVRVERERTTRLHFHQIQANLLPRDSWCRDADASADSGQLVAVVVEQVHPLPTEDIANVFFTYEFTECCFEN